MTTINNIATTPTANYQPYSTKRDGLTFNNCDSEPVQTPGCIQAHGGLLVLRIVDLCILQASENIRSVVGYEVAALLNRPIREVIGEDGEIQLRGLLTAQSTDCNPLYLLTLPANFNGNGIADALDVTCHTIDGIVILEFESTGRTDTDIQDYYASLKITVARLQNARSLSQFCDLVTDEIRGLTGMSRVMIYKFHEDGHGEVIAESKQPTLSPWLGLHFPAEDFPKPARDVFSKIWLRPIPDISGDLAELVPLVNPDTNKPLDMTYCFLRGVSVMYTEYLHNIKVTGSATMAIRRDGNLWGLIACHHYDGPKHVPYQVRSACELLAQVVSLQHNVAEDKDHLVYRLKLANIHQQLLSIAARTGGIAALAENAPLLLDGIVSGGAAVYQNGHWTSVGNTPSESQLKELGHWLNKVKFPDKSHTLYATDCLMRDYPVATGFAETASGLLVLPLSRHSGDLIMWFRPETRQTVNWAGNPLDMPMVTGPNGPRLTPRKSFELFEESVQERSLPWKQVELEAAANFRLQLVEVVVEYAEQRASINTELAHSQEELDAFKYVASHDLKEPLRGIHQYAFQLAEDAALLNDKDRSKLDRMVRLTMRMDTLLNSLLHFSRIGKAALTLELVDLNEVVAEAVEMVGGSELEKLELIIPRLLPKIRCNRAWCREVFINLISNSMRFNDDVLKRIEIGTIAVGELHSRSGFPVGSDYQLIFYVADNGIGIEPKYFTQIFKLFKRLHGRDEYGGGTGTGLTVVRKLVERHRGKIWLDSVPRKGTTFYFTLPCEDARNL